MICTKIIIHFTYKYWLLRSGLTACSVPSWLCPPLGTQGSTRSKKKKKKVPGRIARRIAQKKGCLKSIERKGCRATLLKSNMELNLPFLKSPNMELCYGLEWILFPRKSCNYSSSWIKQPKSNLEPNAGPNWTQSAQWNSQHGIWTSYPWQFKADVKFNWEPKWFFRVVRLKIRCERPSTTHSFFLSQSRYHALNLGGAIVGFVLEGGASASADILC